MPPSLTTDPLPRTRVRSAGDSRGDRRGARGGRGPRRGGRIAAAIGLLVVLAAGAVAVAVALWSHASIETDPEALAALRSPSFGAHVAGVTVRDGHGREVPVALRGGRLWPKRHLAPGEEVTVIAHVRRSSWLGAVLGDDQEVRRVIGTPEATVATRWPRVPAGAPVRVRFSQPVRAIAVGPAGHRHRRTLRAPTADVALGHRGASGAVEVAGVARTWERLPKPASVTWFPAGGGARALVSPAPGTKIPPGTDLEVTYSEPLDRLGHDPKPSLGGNAPGAWRRVDSHTLRFRPGGAGFPLGTDLRLTLPSGVEATGGGRTVSWTVPAGSTKRLQQLLAQLGYLPLDWAPSGAPVAKTVAAQQNAAVDAPDGTFSWRYGNVPSTLRALWQPGEQNEVTRGALMAFESDHGLDVDALAGPQVWKAIIDAAISGKGNTAGYSYVLVHRDVPQSLMLWHDGKTLMTTPANTGVPRAPTELGTFPVYLRLRTQTMRGTNPDGSHYSDPGIKWISYFHGGEAIHGFERASYGTPQSVGCVELPVSAAEKVWPHTPIGTLVTIAH